MTMQGEFSANQTRGTDVVIPADGVFLEGTLSVPREPVGLVVFAHGSGSSRLSPRNRFVAHRLNAARLATLLFDLLTPEEHAEDSQTAEHRFDIPLLSHRLTAVVRWSARQDQVKALPVGLFGASTGAAAALMSAAECPGRVKAVVSRGGRPDLANEALAEVQAPTLLIVGALDTAVVEFNRRAAGLLGAEHQLVLVPDATHLFEEAGALDEVAFLASDWFERHLGAHPRLPGTARLHLIQ